MQGDFTRDTFDPARLFSRVLKQQGRVDLDADWNELVAILVHAQRQTTMDALGGVTFPDGTPVSHGIWTNTPEGGDAKGFQITLPGSPPNPPKYGLESGAYYVAGIRCETKKIENAELIFFDPATGALSKKTEWPNDVLFVLDVWERHVSALNDDLAEIALKGADTATRAKVCSRVIGVIDFALTQAEEAEAAKLDALPLLAAKGLWALYRVGANRMPRMYATVKTPQDAADVCEHVPASGYQGLDNYLYRVEIHAAATKAGTPDELKARFKWARDNGSSVFPIRKLGVASAAGADGALTVNVELQAIPRFYRERLSVGAWVEALDDELSKNGLPGPMLQITSIDFLDRRLTLNAHKGSAPAGAPAPAGAEPSAYKIRIYDNSSPSHPSLRLWDQKVKPDYDRLVSDFGTLEVKESPLPKETESPDAKSFVEIENGIQVTFANNADNALRSCRPGDYWQIPARSESGNILWEPESADWQTKFRKPNGVVHDYAPLLLKTSSGLEPLRRLVVRNVVGDSSRMVRAIPSELSADFENTTEQLTRLKELRDDNRPFNELSGQYLAHGSLTEAEIDAIESVKIVDLAEKSESELVALGISSEKAHELFEQIQRAKKRLDELARP